MGMKPILSLGMLPIGREPAVDPPVGLLDVLEDDMHLVGLAEGAAQLALASFARDDRAGVGRGKLAASLDGHAARQKDERDPEREQSGDPHHAQYPTRSASRSTRLDLPASRR